MSQAPPLGLTPTEASLTERLAVRLARPVDAATRARATVAQGLTWMSHIGRNFGARITAGGRTVTAVDALGDPENPLGRDGLAAKLRTLVAWGDLPTRWTA